MGVLIAQPLASDSVAVTESAVNTIAAAMAADMGGHPSQYIDYAKGLGSTLTLLTRSQQEIVLEEDPSGLLNVLNSAPVESPGDSGEEGSNAWEDFWNWFSGLLG